MKEKSIKDSLLELEINGKATFPAMRLKSVRTVASELGFMTDRKFRVNGIRTEAGNIIEVTRTL